MLKELKKICLDENEYLLVERGWGNEVSKNTILEKFIYLSGGYNVTGYVSFPKNIKEKLPVIIWNRGGDNKSGLLDDFLAYGILGEISSWGYTVLASQYRENDEFGGSDVDDIVNLIELANNFDFIDSSKIGMEGWSRGGMMSYLTLTKTEKINCAVIVSGLANLIRNKKLLVKSFLKNFDSTGSSSLDDELKNRSAIYFADKICKNTPVLFIHGTADEIVTYQDSVDMYNKLKSVNIKGDYELKLIEGGDHYLRNSRKQISELRKNWFESYLKL